MAIVKQDTKVTTQEEVYFDSDEIEAILMAHADSLFAKLRGVGRTTICSWDCGDVRGITVHRESVRYKGGKFVASDEESEPLTDVTGCDV